jgi:hypothetical protein
MFLNGLTLLVRKDKGFGFVPPLLEISSNNVCVEEDDVLYNWTNQLNT